MLGSLPVELRIAAFCFIGAVILVCIALLVWPKRDARPDDKVGPRTAAMRAQARHRDRGTTSADKGAYHPDELSQADTDPGLVIHKLPGQDRLTRRTVTGPDIADWPDKTDQPAVSAVPDDHPSGATSPSQRPDPAVGAGQSEPGPEPEPEHLPTTAMPALGRPAVPGAPAQPPGAPPAPTAPPPAPPDPATTLLPRAETRAETRAERRIRLKAEAERQDLKDQKHPQRPAASSGDPGTPT